MLVSKLYLSGPIKLDREGAPARFAAVEARVQAVGYETVNPFDCPPLCLCLPGTDENPDGRHYDCFMRGDIVRMMECSGIVMLKNWTESKGARIEYDLARSLHMKVFFESQFK